MLQCHIQKKEVQKVTETCRDLILLGFVDDGKRFVFYLHYHVKHQGAMAQYHLLIFKREPNYNMANQLKSRETSWEAITVVIARDNGNWTTVEIKGSRQV